MISAHRSMIGDGIAVRVTCFAGDGGQSGISFL